MLEMRANCECSDKDLPPDSKDACICTFECTFCGSLKGGVLDDTCPNCGGNLVQRPIRPSDALTRHPASEPRVLKPGGCVSSAV